LPSTSRCERLLLAFEAMETAGAEREEPNGIKRRLVLIDDDELSREVLGLIAAEAGLEAVSFESGEDALAYLANADEAGEFTVLSDMQMPGISGNDLAERLRTVCGAGTLLLAMSGSTVIERKLATFDGFLLKPFSADDLSAACSRKPTEAARAVTDAAILNEAVYANFARSMPAGPVAALYKMCLDDAQKRLGTMRRALAERDDATYRRAAHAIKGGCGMVGALELAELAADMERDGLAAVHDETPLDQFAAASARLKRMLEAKESALDEAVDATRL
jgi:CheY-like chemotaxis protein